jgi:hypothetical protein
MMYNRHVPFDPATGWIIEDNLAGLSFGDFFWDQKGRKFRLTRLSNALAGDTTAAGNVLCLDNESTTNIIATNDVSESTSATDPIALGVCTGALAESAGVTTATYRFVLLLVHGHQDPVTTNGDNNGVIGDTYIIDETADGDCDVYIPLHTTAGAGVENRTLFHALARAFVGIGLDAEASGSVQMLVSINT